MMNYKAVSLEDMLLCREKRAYIQNEMINKYKNSLICLTLNIPGEYKVSDNIKIAFDIAKKRILDKLSINNIKIVKELEIKEHTGFEFYLAVDFDAILIKKLCIEIENQDKLSRLFDIDILDKNKNKIDRNLLEIPVRKCLMCNEEAKVCSRSRKHSVKELIDEINIIIENHI